MPSVYKVKPRDIIGGVLSDSLISGRKNISRVLSDSRIPKNTTDLDFSSLNDYTRSERFFNFFRRILRRNERPNNAYTRTEYTALSFTKDLLENLPNLVGLKNIPDNFAEIIAPNFTGLQSLDLTGCKDLTNLNLSGCLSLTSLTNIPLSIINLVLPGCKALSEIDLTEYSNLKKLDIEGCNFEILNLSKCIWLQEIKLPTSVTAINLSGCWSVKNLDLNGFNKLTKIDLHDCRALTSIKIPPSATNIDLSGCKNLKSLDLAECVNLKKLNLTDCGNLQYDTRLKQQLENLEATGCEIDFPPRLSTPRTSTANPKTSLSSSSQNERS